MDKKLIQVGLMGMNKDVINSKTAQQQAYEIKNFRLSATQDSNAFELTTERGTKSVPLNWYENPKDPTTLITVKGTIIGYCILNNYLVLFTTDHQRLTDRIYRLTLNSNEFEEEVTEIVLLYEGDTLNFSSNYLIDSIPYYETELIQKVYWIDGLNQPRVINIVSDKDIHTPLNNPVDYDPYGFVQEIYGDYNSIQVTKGYVGGMFHAGVIQYAYSFFNENAQETPIIDVTPLYYIAHEDRGEKPDTRVGCTFTLSLDIPEGFLKKFDYVRFYSIYRSSLDTTPLVKVINEIEINNPTATQPENYTFIDDNTQGYVYDTQQLLIRNNKIIPQTFNYKDGKMFFGNYKNDLSIAGFDDDDFNDIQTEWQRNKEIYIQNAGTRDVYNYKSQLNENSQKIKTFKAGEIYHIGVQLQDIYGNWSQPYYISSVYNPLYPVGDNTAQDFVYDSYNVATINTTDNIRNIISSHPNILNKYIRIRPVVSFPTTSERRILYQGVVNPTVFNLQQRENRTCHSQSSWFFRPFPNKRFLSGNEINGVYKYRHGIAHVQWEHYAPLFNTKYLNGEIQCMYSKEDVQPLNGSIIIPTSEFSTERPFDHSSSYYEGITEYEAQALYLLHISDFTYDGIVYSYIHNFGTPDQPEASYTENTIEYTWYVYLTKVEITDGTHNGLKYEMSILIKSEDLATGQIWYTIGTSDISYVSTSGEEWIYQTSYVAENERKRPYAHSITNSTKRLYDSYYFTDTQICTVNSPDIEFDTSAINVDVNNYSLQLVGSSRFVNCTGKYNIIANSPNFLNDVKPDSERDVWIRSTKLAQGFKINKFELNTNINNCWSNSGGCVLSALDCWYDDACNLWTYDDDTFKWNQDSFQHPFVVYPWQRKYLNNFNKNVPLYETPDDKTGITTENGEPSLIIKKILANLRVCYTDYFDRKQDISTEYIKLFNSNEASFLKLANDRFYQGNVDQLVTCVSEYEGRYAEKVVNDLGDGHTRGIKWQRKLLTGYPILLGRSHTIADNTYNQGKTYQLPYVYFGDFAQSQSMQYYKMDTSPNNRSTDPIWIRYKSTPHLVFKQANGDVLPVLDKITTITNGRQTFETIWGDESINPPQQLDIPNVPHDIQQSYLFIADIYNPTVNTSSISPLDKFNLLNRVWLPCGDSIWLDPDGSTADEHIVWSEGDTFFQRYDCLKTYPFSNDDYQSVVEIGSFMLETRVNLDGRYDTNRGLMDNTAITKENFNLINPVYSQMNNFFQYKILDDRFNNKETEYKNRITWTLDKQNGDDVDQWTRVTELGILDLDGDKGKVTKIERFDNNLYIFQDKGIARLNYNDNIQIPTEGNIPIEVINSGFINGKRYISENQGLQDKWCSKSTPYGIFFKDDYSKALCTLKYDERRNPIIGPLSYGSMQKWTEQNINSIYRVNYDNQVNEVLFMIEGNEDYSSLNYSPLYQTFTAFYNYKDWIANYNNSTISLLKDDSYYYNNTETQDIYFIRRQDAGFNEPRFNWFYDDYKPYWVKWTSVVDNYDCIFNNIYYKGDLFNKEENSMNDNDIITLEDTYSNPVFKEISVSNDYQTYELEGNDIWKPFKPIKKFRVWRGVIPRLTINGRYMGSRIRNHWVRIGLRNNEPDEYKAIVRDLKVEAFF